MGVGLVGEDDEVPNILRRREQEEIGTVVALGDSKVISISDQYFLWDEIIS